MVDPDTPMPSKVPVKQEPEPEQASDVSEMEVEAEAEAQTEQSENKVLKRGLKPLRLVCFPWFCSYLAALLKFSPL